VTKIPFAAQRIQRHFSSGCSNLLRWLRQTVRAAKDTPPVLGETEQWRLLHMVYADPLVLFVSLPVTVMVGLVVWTRIGTPWPLIWLAGTLAAGGFRIWDFYGFSRRVRSRDLPALRRRFIVTVWALASAYSSASLILLVSDDHLAIFWALSVQSAFLATSVARNHAIKPATMGSIYIVQGPLLIACMLNADVYIRAYGVLVVLYAATGIGIARDLHARTLCMLHADAANATLLEELSESNAQLGRANQRLAERANTDALTGLTNRGGFDEALASAWRAAMRSGTSIGLLLADVDHFKAFNDRFGHPAGDHCLAEVAICMENMLKRAGDLAARYGGEEFAIILPQTDAFGTIDIGERIRAAVQAHGLPSADGGVVTLSIGAACRVPAHGENAAALIAAADAALYRAKQDGRNCVRCAEAVQTT
jgi:diguanylate cyclase (GGDEF)-like protein